MRRGIEVPVSNMFQIRISVDCICSSVPFAFGSDAIKLPLKRGFLDPTAWTRANGLFSNIPLFFAAVVGDCVPPDQRLWIKGRLEWLGSTVGYKAASLMAQKISVRDSKSASSIKIGVNTPVPGML